MQVIFSEKRSGILLYILHSITIFKVSEVSTVVQLHNWYTPNTTLILLTGMASATKRIFVKENQTKVVIAVMVFYRLQLQDKSVLIYIFTWAVNILLIIFSEQVLMFYYLKTRCCVNTVHL